MKDFRKQSECIDITADISAEQQQIRFIFQQILPDLPDNSALEITAVIVQVRNKSDPLTGSFGNRSRKFINNRIGSVSAPPIHIAVSAYPAPVFHALRGIADLKILV